ncbi:hypothetical protein L6164_006532 [Bauhinia variegata]|uniref:Uncharacterized protein n=1 Tax=Bauhinia variegata TaxID=167791 RepID=A0ACB9PUS5_BAUVA|nr:hypothetical protein L6164_006532 [Bauhinia variegata]
MKTILVAFLVFASIIFFSSTTFARVVTYNGDKYADTEKRLDGISEGNSDRVLVRSLKFSDFLQEHVAETCHNSLLPLAFSLLHSFQSITLFS